MQKTKINNTLPGFSWYRYLCCCSTIKTYQCLTVSEVDFWVVHLFFSSQAFFYRRLNKRWKYFICMDCTLRYYFAVRGRHLKKGRTRTEWHQWTDLITNRNPQWRNKNSHIQKVTLIAIESYDQLTISLPVTRQTSTCSRANVATRLNMSESYLSVKTQSFSRPGNVRGFLVFCRI